MLVAYRKYRTHDTHPIFMLSFFQIIECLAGHIAAQNNDYISQAPLLLTSEIKFWLREHR